MKPQLPFYWLQQRPWPIMALVALVTLVTVYFSEYGFGLKPCHLCLLQRWPWWILLFVALFGVWWSSQFPAKPKPIWLIWLIIVILLGSLSLASYHAGVEYGFWPGPTSCSSTAAALNNHDFNDLLALANQPPAVPCGVPAFTIMGISMAGMNAIWSFLWLGLFVNLAFSKNS